MGRCVLWPEAFFHLFDLLFVGSSLMAGAAPNLPTLIVCRVLQGLGGPAR